MQDSTPASTASHVIGALPLPRRAALKSLLALAGMGTGLGEVLAQGSNFQTDSAALSANAQAWRAMARVGYGPTAALVRAVQSERSPKTWALQQIDLAYAASQKPPVLDKELAGINAPLPEIFVKFQEERRQRKDGKGKPDKAKHQEKPSKSDMLAGDDEYFSRAMAMQAGAWHMRSCSQPGIENPLLARMTEFWFNHLNVYSGKGAVRPFVGHYLINVARKHALGKFEDLLLASARHPAMLMYLDQAQSVADGSRGGQGKSPRGLNENYARELMELHTLGVDGGYAQSDVRELARVLTGWTVGPQEASGFRFVPRLHDSGKKTVLGTKFSSGAFGNGEQEGIDAIRMLARHPSTARRVCLRLARFLVADQPAPELVQAMAKTFSQTQGDMRSVLHVVIESKDFWAAENKLFKTPMDYACSALAATESSGEPRNLLLATTFLNSAGQPIHGWQTPDGYAFDAATWLVPEALTRRADFALTLAKRGDTDFLLPFLSQTTRNAIAQERPAMRAGLMLASPDFMYK